MTDRDLRQSVRRLYRLTAFFSLIGFVCYFWAQGALEAFGFALGALGSFGNLWLFTWLSRVVASTDTARKPWQAGLFVGRYLVLFLVGYAIVQGLDVSPLAVVLGLFASTAAVLAVSIIEIIQGLLGKQSID